MLFSVALFLLPLPELPPWVFVLFFVRLRFLLEFLLADGRLLLDLTLTSVEDSRPIGVIGIFSVVADCVAASVVCATLCQEGTSHDCTQ